MYYRKFKADYLFTGKELLDANNVLITDEAGVIKDIVEEKNAGDDVEIFEGILSHAPYTVSKRMFHLINEASAGKIVSIHKQECLAEDELYKTGAGDFFKLYHHLNIDTEFFQPFRKTSLQSYLPLLDKPQKLL